MLWAEQPSRGNDVITIRNPAVARPPGLAAKPDLPAFNFTDIKPFRGMEIRQFGRAKALSGDIIDGVQQLVVLLVARPADRRRIDRDNPPPSAHRDLGTAQWGQLSHEIPQPGGAAAHALQ